MDWVRMKSSAVSVSSPAALGGRDSVPIFPSGLPVEKKVEKKESAEARGASESKAIKVKPKASLAAVAQSNRASVR